MRRARGLTMIEVLAAMVIFSAGAVVLFGWIGQTADRLARINTEQRQLFAELTALEYLRSLNPMQRPTGEQPLADAIVRWQSMPVGGETAARTPSGGEGVYVVQLYKTQVRVEVGGSHTERVLYLAGWRQTRVARGQDIFGVSPGATPPAPR